MGFCNGAVRFISYSIQFGIHDSLGNRYDGRVINVQKLSVARRHANVRRSDRFRNRRMTPPGTFCCDHPGNTTRPGCLRADQPSGCINLHEHVEPNSCALRSVFLYCVNTWTYILKMRDCVFG